MWQAFLFLQEKKRKKKKKTKNIYIFLYNNFIFYFIRISPKYSSLGTFWGCSCRNTLDLKWIRYLLLTCRHSVRVDTINCTLPTTIHRPPNLDQQQHPPSPRSLLVGYSSLLRKITPTPPPKGSGSTLSLFLTFLILYLFAPRQVPFFFFFFFSYFKK